MPNRISLSVLLLLSVGALQTLAATPRIQLEIGTDASGCISVESCSYGCGKISPSTSEKNILTPICPAVELKADYPQHLTIRGKSKSPHLFDEDRGHIYRCREVEASSQRFVCRYEKKKSAKSVQASVSASVHPSAVNNISRSASASSSIAAPTALHLSVDAFGSSVVGKASSTKSGIPAEKSTSAEPVAATAEDTDLCEYIPEIYGTGRGLGNLDDCCFHNDDCHGSCISGACDSEKNIPTETWITKAPLPTETSCVKKRVVYGKARGLGNLGECCVNSDDCRGACVSGSCNAENNVPATKCSDNTFKGKRNGKGPEGVCCTTQADCQESCDRGVCTRPQE